MELAGLEILLLIFVALLAGAINTVAGGGSSLVLPTLMIMGMPPEVANATNRVGIFVESVVAVSEFKRHARCSVLLLLDFTEDLFRQGLDFYYWLQLLEPCVMTSSGLTRLSLFVPSFSLLCRLWSLFGKIRWHGLRDLFCL